ncbi:hypothetical protein D1872_280860 [compost metagenome]
MGHIHHGIRFGSLRLRPFPARRLVIVGTVRHGHDGDDALRGYGARHADRSVGSAGIHPGAVKGKQRDEDIAVSADRPIQRSDLDLFRFIGKQAGPCSLRLVFRLKVSLNMFGHVDLSFKTAIGFAAPTIHVCQPLQNDRLQLL